MIKKKNPSLSVVMPCLNEEKTVGICVKKAKEVLRKNKISGEVIVVDNGSTDNSAKEAEKAGAIVVKEAHKGYGSAYLAGFRQAKGDWLVIGDSDGTYDFSDLPKLIKPLGEGYDLVVGSRLSGRIKKGAMPFLNRYLGTPFLNFFLRWFYKIKISDSQSGMRAFTRSAFEQLKLKTLGMEFASEMLVRASQVGLKIGEVPISYWPRQAPTKLSRFRDAWRHIRFMLLFAPTYVFLFPGGLFMGLGLLGLVLLAKGPFCFSSGYCLDFHAMILASMLALLGYQVVMLGVYAKVFSYVSGLDKGGWTINTTLRYFKLEKGLVLGFIVTLVGFLIGFVTFLNWARAGFGFLWAIRPAIISLTLLVLGMEIIFSSFFLSILGLERK
ncbi:MAG: Undecaprenyl-phosphate mannosyltransferase [Microgenomates group bacterium ADurb.Bin219]|nr:MAG: Undecaprenyl-phosphate mannosyltransferase [Microgenomates group bacterium ADurb.Bin219]HNP89179.1 glycosyltransferase family 2 protein [Candidatus Woesebacteria bacterium]